MKLEIGQEIKLDISEVEKVELIEELGTGGAGHVWKVKNLSPANTDYYVLKHIRLDPDLDQEQRSDYIQRIIREASVNVDSDYIIKCLGLSKPEPDNFVLLFPYAPGQNFAEWIQENLCRPWNDKKRIFLKILEGVRALHQAKIIHRDLKPKNILIVKFYETPYILDFGLAKFRGKEGVTEIGTIAGTDAYIAPEAFGWGGIKGVDERCDIYAMGVTLYELVVGQNPWRANSWNFGDFARYLQRQDADGKSTYDNILDIDTKFEFEENAIVPEVIRRSTMFEPLLRLQTVDEMIKALQDTSLNLRQSPASLSFPHSGDTAEIVRQALEHEREEQMRESSPEFFAESQPEESIEESYTKLSKKQQVGMVTGAPTGTYIRFGREIAEQAKKCGIDILVKESKGSIENIKRLLSPQNTVFAIVQSDVLGVVKRLESPESRKVVQRLRLIYPFYNEEVHLFANQSIQRFEDLQGKRVVVGTKGSGNWLTAENLLQMTGVEPGEKLYLEPAEATKAVLIGEVDAMFYVVGKPTKQFLNLNDVKSKYPQLIEKVHFVPLDDQSMLQEYVPSQISSQDYVWFDHTIPTIAVKAVLVTYDFSSKDTLYYRMRCEQVYRVAQAIRKSIDELRAYGHEKWKEVNLDEQLGFWALDPCSRREVKPVKSGGLVDELERTIKQGW